MTTLIKKRSFILAAGLVTTATVSGSLIATGVALNTASVMKVGLCNMVDAVPAETPEGKVVIAATGLACLTLGSAILYKTGKNVSRYLKVNSGFKIVMRSAINRRIVPATIEELTFFTIRGVGAIGSVACWVFVVAGSVSLFECSHHCFKKLTVGVNEKD